MRRGDERSDRLGGMVARWWRALEANPGRRDLIVAGCWLLLGLLLTSAGIVRLWASLAVVSVPNWAFVLPLVGICGATILRSRKPLVALGLGVALTVVDLSFGGSLAVIFILTDLIYAAVKYGSERAIRVLLGCGIGCAVVLGAVLIWSPLHDTTVPIFWVQWVLIVAVPAMWGWSVRSERMRTRSEMARQHVLSARQLRGRIAHDLHDLVANQIAVAGLHVEAAKLVAARHTPDTATLMRSLEQAKRGTDEAHHELRHLIAVLSAVDGLDEPEAPALLDELHELARLVPSGRALEHSGESDKILREALSNAPPAHQQVLLRALQELVVNAVKHGAGDIQIHAHIEPSDGLHLSVANDVPPKRSSALGSGLGIRGTELLLGSIGARLESAARDRQGGWCANIVVPLPRTNRRTA